MPKKSMNFGRRATMASRNRRHETHTSISKSFNRVKSGDLSSPTGTQESSQDTAEKSRNMQLGTRSKSVTGHLKVKTDIMRLS